MGSVASDDLRRAIAWDTSGARIDERLATSRSARPCAPAVIGSDSELRSRTQQKFRVSKAPNPFGYRYLNGGI